MHFAQLVPVDAMRFVQRAVAVTLASVVFAGSASGQDGSFPREPSILAPIVLGAGLGVAGAVAGGLIGFALDQTCETKSWCVDPGGLAGIAVMGTVGASVGAHLGNRRRGSLGYVLLGSCAAWGASLLLMVPVALVNPVAASVGLLFVPLVQFAATVATERITGRRNEARHGGQDAVSLLVAPDRRGGMRVGVNIRF
jgi:hypothetical protein